VPLLGDDGRDGHNIHPIRPTSKPKLPTHPKDPTPRSDYYDPSDPLWFLNPNYRPRPEADIEVGEYRFCYRPEYHDYYQHRGADGMSLGAISAELGIPFAIIKQWARIIPEFAVALELAHESAQKYWETIGHADITKRDFNAAGYLKMMAVRFPQTWREISTDATVASQTDPYGFEREVLDEEANIDAEAIFQRLIRLKETEQTGT
jgi:hypothetical protein